MILFVFQNLYAMLSDRDLRLMSNPRCRSMSGTMQWSPCTLDPCPDILPVGQTHLGSLQPTVKNARLRAEHENVAQDCLTLAIVNPPVLVAATLLYLAERSGLLESAYRVDRPIVRLTACIGRSGLLTVSRGVEISNEVIQTTHE
jgi:hypothetical protein